jgi:chemotaxis protein methyltransferase CheR
MCAEPFPWVNSRRWKWQLQNDLLNFVQYFFMSQMMEMSGLTEGEYTVIRDLLHDRAGIALGPAKKALVAGRLLRRVQTLGLATYGEYFAKLKSGAAPDELQTALDLLTTNETYFFRESKHFAMLEELAAAAPKNKPFRVWSAASSTGEEAYTIAMTLQELRRKARCPDFEVRGSDLSMRVLAQARSGLYTMDRTDGIPPELMKRYFLQGTGPYEGHILVDKALREKTEFAQINLIEPLPDLAPFDAIFLRNVMIYFDRPTKRKVVTQLLSTLAPGGVLFVGLAETLNGIVDGLISIGPGAYRVDKRSSQKTRAC